MFHSPLLLLFLLFGFDIALSVKSRNSIHFELIQRNHTHRQPDESQGRFERVKELLSNGAWRGMEQGKLHRRREIEIPSNATSFSLPLFSGMYARTAQYFVKLHIGTPAQKFVLVADTGSDLTWINCHRCRRCQRPRVNRRIPVRRRIFHALNSSSYHSVPCSSPMCKTLPFSLTMCPTPIASCAYDYGYVDGSGTKGFYANESVTITLPMGQKAKFKNVVVGCSVSSTGGSFQEADGVLGLGLSDSSFGYNAIQRFGGKFSYCLVDRRSPKNVSSCLTFGKSLTERTLKFADLLLDQRILPYYGVQVIGISVGSTMLRIPRDVWNLDKNGGAIVDLGTSITMLVEPAYKIVTDALKKPFERFQKIEVKPFQFCFNVTGYHEKMVPKLTMHLSPSTRFMPHAKSYFVEVDTGIRCIGFLPARWPGISVLGNILQQNFFWEFDVTNQKLGFKKSTCI